LEDLHDFDIRREGRRWSPEEIERKWRPHQEAPEKLELIDGKLFLSEGQRITMLGWLLEMVGADSAVRLGDPEVWREAVEDHPVPAGKPGAGVASRERSRERIKKLEALADEVRKVVESSGWRDRNVYWPEGMHLVEERLAELDRLEGAPRTEH
jgi:hypothetical protein